MPTIDIDYAFVGADFPLVDGDGGRHHDSDAQHGHQFRPHEQHHDRDHNSKHHRGDHHERLGDGNGDFDDKDSGRLNSGDPDEYGEENFRHDDRRGHRHGHGNIV